MIASCSHPRAFSTSEEKNELTQEMFKFFPLVTSIYSWEKHEVNCPVRLGTFYNQRFEVITYPFYLHHLVLAFRNCFIRKPPVHTISNGCASCAPRPSQKPRSDFSDMQISKTRELKITCMYNRRQYIQIRRSTSSTNSTIKFQIILTHCCLWNFDCFH